MLPALGPFGKPWAQVAFTSGALVSSLGWQAVPVELLHAKSDRGWSSDSEGGYGDEADNEWTDATDLESMTPESDPDDETPIDEATIDPELQSQLRMLGRSYKLPQAMSTAPGNVSAACGTVSTARGSMSTTPGIVSVACGTVSTASGSMSTTPGIVSAASGTVSTAPGNVSAANGTESAALGTVSTANGTESTALGIVSTALGIASAASGVESTAPGTVSAASGVLSTAPGSVSAASGGVSTAVASTGSVGVDEEATLPVGVDETPEPKKKGCVYMSAKKRKYDVASAVKNSDSQRAFHTKIKEVCTELGINSNTVYKGSSLYDEAAAQRVRKLAKLK